MSRIVIDPDKLPAQKKRLDPRLQAVILVIALAVLIGLLELLIPGTTAFILSLLKIAVTAIWNMLCSIAAAGRDFLEWVDRQRS